MGMESPCLVARNRPSASVRPSVGQCPHAWRARQQLTGGISSEILCGGGGDGGDTSHERTNAEGRERGEYVGREGEGDGDKASCSYWVSSPPPADSTSKQPGERKRERDESCFSCGRGHLQFTKLSFLLFPLPASQPWPTAAPAAGRSVRPSLASNGRPRRQTPLQEGRGRAERGGGVEAVVSPAGLTPFEEPTGRTDEV